MFCVIPPVPEGRALVIRSSTRKGLGNPEFGRELSKVWPRIVPPSDLSIGGAHQLLEPNILYFFFLMLKTPFDERFMCCRVRRKVSC